MRYRSPRRFALLAILLVVQVGGGVAISRIPEHDQAGNPLVCDLEGPYETAYGFALVIPKGFKGCPGWHRTWMVPLGSNAEDRYVVFSAGTYAAAMGDLHNWVSELIASDQENPDHSDVALLARESAWLDTLPAERYSVRYRQGGARDAIVHDSVHAFSLLTFLEDDEPRWIYGVTLVTTEEDYSADRVTFESIVASWQVIQPLNSEGQSNSLLNLPVWPVTALAGRDGLCF